MLLESKNAVIHGGAGGIGSGVAGAFAREPAGDLRAFGPRQIPQCSKLIATARRCSPG
jgi:NAD(P)-dependent dehydrogenase (short-subunit alcohol dehydrogenase family)